MEGLSQKRLFAACRALYEMACKEYVLPPLIREVGSGEEQPSQAYDCPVDEDQIHFSVTLDEAFADRNTRIRSKLPLKFQLELRDPRNQTAVDLSDSEKHELIRAFLLGAKLPISAEKTDEESRYNLFVQLSSTFFVDCGELSGDHGNRLSKDICEVVGRQIYERSKDFFAEEEQGLAVWSLRAAQELFGDEKPIPETFWPSIVQDPVAAPPPVAAIAAQRDMSWRTRSAMAATIVIGLLGSGILAAKLAMLDEVRAGSETAVGPSEFTVSSLRAPGDSTASGDLRDAVDRSRALDPALDHRGGVEPPVNEAHNIAPAAIVGAPAFSDSKSASVSQDSVDHGDDQTLLFAPAPIAGTTYRLSVPVATPSRPFVTKRSSAAKVEYRSLVRHDARSAMATKHRTPRPLKIAETALASLAGVVKSIGRIPAKIFKQNRRLKS